MAARTRQHLCNIMRHAVHQELIENNPAANLGGIIAPPVKRHYPALPLEQLPELLARIEDYRQGRELTRLASWSDCRSCWLALRTTSKDGN